MNDLQLQDAVILAHELEFEDFGSLTFEEKNKISDLNSKNHYGISKATLKTLISKHKMARKNNNTHDMEAIEYRLTDINFHSECGMLSKGKYDEAYKTLENW